MLSPQTAGRDIKVRQSEAGGGKKTSPLRSLSYCPPFLRADCFIYVLEKTRRKVGPRLEPPRRPGGGEAASFQKHRPCFHLGAVAAEKTTLPG